MIAVGLDMSLTGTGLCKNVDGKIEIGTIKTTAHQYGEYERLDVITEKVLAFIPKDVSIICIESVFTPFRAGQIGSAMGLIGLGQIVRLKMWKAGLIFVDIAPTRLKKFVLGKGNGDKDMVVKEVFKKWGIDAGDNNQADAVVLAMIGEALVKYRSGQTEGFTKYQLEVLKAIESE